MKNCDDEIAVLEQEALIWLEAVPLDEFSEARLCREFRDPNLNPDARALPNAGGAARALLEYRGGNRAAALAWARGFVVEFLADIRTSLCPKGAKPQAKRRTNSRLKGASARAAATAIASWLAAAFSIANPFAIALATFIVTVIGSAALAAFCVMTDDEVLKGLRPVA